ncbi:MAG: hypothetical protein ACLFTK_08700 [Anaerolineales bacterium]
MSEFRNRASSFSTSEDANDGQPDENTKPIQPMQPPPRRAPLAGRESGPRRERPPIAARPGPVDELPPEEDPYPERPRAAHREVDPLVAYLVILAIAIGISPLEAPVRYVLLWVVMGGLGAVAYLLGGVQRMADAQLDDLVWGAMFGLFSSFPFLVVFGSALETVSVRMFNEPDIPAAVMDTWVLMAVAFVLPLCESLFFRGGMQDVRSVLLTAVLATVWSVILFFPHMELAGREAIGGILVIVFALLNFMYSYVRFRNGLAAAWLTQVISYVLLWFVPRLIF